MISSEHNLKGCKNQKKTSNNTTWCFVNYGKLDPLIIRPNKNSHCFKNISQLPLPYHSTIKALMTSLIFKKFLNQTNQYFFNKNKKNYNFFR